MDDKKYTLECNGIQLKTNYWMPISDEEYAKARHDYFGTDEVEVHKRSYGTTNGMGENHTHNGNENMFIFTKKGNK